MPKSTDSAAAIGLPISRMLTPKVGDSNRRGTNLEWRGDEVAGVRRFY
jgi:hypothetical protein